MWEEGRWGQLQGRGLQGQHPVYPLGGLSATPTSPVGSGGGQWPGPGNVAPQQNPKAQRRPPKAPSISQAVSQPLIPAFMAFQVFCALGLALRCSWAVCCVCAQSCLTLCNPMDCSPPGSSVHVIFQARILQWVAMPSSRGSS